MKAPDFAYERPSSLAAALALLSDKTIDAVPLAGGQSLMPMMNFRMASPDLLVDLAGIEDLRGISVNEKDVEIGAMTRYSDLAAAPEVIAHVPLIGRALPHIAHAAIRNRGTIGGSISLADPAAEMPALLLALGASIVVQGQEGQRTIPADTFFKGLFETACEADELVCNVSIPKASADQSFGFYELARRHGDYAMAGVAIAQTARSYRIAFFGVSDRACRAPGAETALNGRDPGDSEAVKSAIDCLDEINFAEDLNAGEQTKQHLAGIVLKRALAGMTL